MGIYYYVILTIFAILAYMIIVDRNVADYIVLIFKLLKVNCQRLYWMVRYHPNNFITLWIENRKYEKIARELRDELD